MSRDNESPWAEAETLEDLIAVNLRWLRGEGFSHPLGGDEPDAETSEILDDLLCLNRRGLLTTFSQPADLDDAGGQRAAVEGYATEQVARVIGAVTLHTDLLVFIYEPGEHGGYQVPITVWDYHPYTWCGEAWGDEDLQWFAEYRPRAMRVLRTLWTVTAIDPKWGRKRYLWRELRRATNPTSPASPYSISPSPKLGLDS